jgi:hypothetical protein
MKLSLSRKTYTDKSTIGTLTFDSFTCNTLELPKSSGQLIPAGIYDCRLDYSNAHGIVLLRIVNFDNDTREIHVGNSAVDTKGCILIGEYDQSMPDWISESRNTYHCYWNALLEELKTDFTGLTLEIA